MSEKTKHSLTRRDFLKTSTVAAGALAMPMIMTSRKASAEPVEINMLGWYGTAEPDMVSEFEAANNVKFVPKYYAGGDNMLAALAQNPPGTFDLIHTDAEYARLLIESELVDVHPVRFSCQSQIVNSAASKTHTMKVRNLQNKDLLRGGEWRNMH